MSAIFSILKKKKCDFYYFSSLKFLCLNKILKIQRTHTLTDHPFRLI